jgi:hypothetical protein
MTENLDTSRAAKFIRMLSSPNHGEVANAAAQLCKQGIHEIAELIENSDASKRLFSAMMLSTTQKTLKLEILKRRIKRLSRENDSLWRMVRDQLKRCAICGKGFIARRADAYTCSSKCRTALHRKHVRKVA